MSQLQFQNIFSIHFFHFPGFWLHGPFSVPALPAVAVHIFEQNRESDLKPVFRRKNKPIRKERAKKKALSVCLSPSARSTPSWRRHLTIFGRQTNRQTSFSALISLEDKNRPGARRRKRFLIPTQQEEASSLNVYMYV